MLFIPSKAKNHFVLADGNNFYVSCEKLFNPMLHGLPVIVLSNNDGCVVSRSQEAKTMGITMGQPYFQIKDFCKKRKVAVFSSHYSLYRDLSARMMSILSESSPDIEIYSIDEAFMQYPASISSEVIFHQSIALRKKIKQWIGLPVSLGIAPTKTLAKVANKLAKKNQVGVCNLSSSLVQREVLQDYPVADIWGIGRKFSEQLRKIGIFTAWQFTEIDPLIIRKKMGVVGERIWWELRGVSCIPLGKTKAKKNIITSRSFSKIVTEKKAIEEALIKFVSMSCLRLRAQGSCANAIGVFLESWQKNFSTRKQHSSVHVFDYPTSDTPQMISAAKRILEKLYLEKERYKRCGVILLDAVEQNAVAPDLFLGNFDPKRLSLMQTFDNVNARFGDNTVCFGTLGKNVRAGNHNRFQYSTTDWNALPIAKA